MNAWNADGRKKTNGGLKWSKKKGGGERKKSSG